MNAQELITTSNMEANMELIFPSLVEEERRTNNEAKKKQMGDHVAEMAIMLEEIKRWNK